MPACGKQKPIEAACVEGLSRTLGGPSRSGTGSAQDAGQQFAAATEYCSRMVTFWSATAPSRRGERIRPLFGMSRSTATSGCTEMGQRAIPDAGLMALEEAAPWARLTACASSTPPQSYSSGDLDASTKRRQQSLLAR